MNDAQKYLVTVVAAFILLEVAVSAYLTPPIVALGDPIRLVLLLAALGGLGLQVQQGYSATKTASLYKRGW